VASSRARRPLFGVSAFLAVLARNLVLSRAVSVSPGCGGWCWVRQIGGVLVSSICLRSQFGVRLFRSWAFFWLLGSGLFGQVGAISLPAVLPSFSRVFQVASAFWNFFKSGCLARQVNF
jgi:hypothetical protein